MVGAACYHQTGCLLRDRIHCCLRPCGCPLRDSRVSFDDCHHTFTLDSVGHDDYLHEARIQAWGSRSSSKPISVATLSSGTLLTFSADSQTCRNRVAAQSYTHPQRHTAQSTFEHSAEERNASLRWLLAGSRNGSRPQCCYLPTEFRSGSEAVAYGLRLEAGKV